MKKYLLLSIFVALGLVGCTNDEPEITTSIKLSATELNLTIGQTAQLTATITPESAEGDVSWSVANSAVATVEAGLVTAVAPGETTITASVGKASARCKIVVSAAAVEGVVVA